MNVKTSYGIILFFIDHRFPDGENYEIKYFLIQRKDTMEYIDYIYNGYSNDNYLSLMTNEELHRIINYDIESLKKDLTVFTVSGGRSFKKASFSHPSKTDFLYSRNKVINYINQGKKSLQETPWEFPKGRKKGVESPKQTALREFKEETGLDTKNIELLNLTYGKTPEVFLAYGKTPEVFLYPITKYYVGSDNKQYAVKFFVAKSKKELLVKKITTPGCIRKASEGSCVSSEVSNANWYNYNTAYSMLVEPFKSILYDVNKIINSSLP